MSDSATEQPQKGGDKHRSKKTPAPKQQSAASSKTALAEPKKFKGEVFLVVSLVVSGRSPLNGWILSLGAVLVAAEKRRVLGLFERNLLPLANQLRVEPTVDVVGFLRRQRPELEFMSRDRCSAIQAMADLARFCAPYSNLTLVGSPLMSIYGWLSYYWSAYQQNIVDTAATSSPPPMPWGFSGLCARSYAAGCLGVPMKQVPKEARYRTASEPFQALGLPLADALAAAAGFTGLYSLQEQPQAASSVPSPAAPPPLTFETAVPEYLVQLGAVPASVVSQSSHNQSPVPQQRSAPPSSAEALCHQALVDLLLDASIRNGLERYAPADGSKTQAAFVEYPSITSLEFHPDFEAALPTALRSVEPWVATEKVHGSNFTIFCDGEEIWAGKRTGWLGMRDSPAFFDFVYLIEEARPAIMACHAHVTAWVRARSTTATAAADKPLVVSIACELAGGEYPHPHVPVELRGTRVQSGVFYCNHNFLYGFDVGVEAIETVAPDLANALKVELQGAVGADSQGADATTLFMPWGPDGRYYLPFDDAQDAFKTSGFPTYSTPRRTATLEAMNADTGIGIFPSTVAAQWFELPTLADNFAEGVVLRPKRDWWMRTNTAHTAGDDADASRAATNKDGSEAWSRVMIKVKHPRFSEFSQKNRTAVSPAKTSPVVSSQVNITDFLTEARVAAVLSKHTQEEQNDTSRMVQAVLADAIKDAEALQRGTKR